MAVSLVVRPSLNRQKEDNHGLLRLCEINLSYLLFGIVIVILVNNSHADVAFHVFNLLRVFINLSLHERLVFFQFSQPLL